MVSLRNIVHFLDDELEIHKFRKDLRNGLVLRGSPEVRRIAVAANTSLANIRAAAQRKANMLIVHHGGWRQRDDTLQQKFSLLRRHRMSLYIAHLSLDAKKGYGNPYALAAHLGLRVQKPFGLLDRHHIGVIARGPRMTFARFCARVNMKLNSRLEYMQGKKPSGRVAIITGSVGRNIQWARQAAEQGCDTFLCGEATSRFRLYAAEKGLNLVCAGHTATERHGLFRLANLLHEQFGVRTVRLKEVLY